MERKSVWTEKRRLKEKDKAKKGENEGAGKQKQIFKDLQSTLGATICFRLKANFIYKRASAAKMALPKTFAKICKGGCTHCKKHNTKETNSYYGKDSMSEKA